MFARPLIDSVDFARQGKNLYGQVPVVELPQMGELLASTEGLLSYALSGHMEGNKEILELTLNGQCQLICQRCLESMPYSIGVSSQFVLVSENQFDEFSDDIEERDSIKADRQLDVVGLLEEELLLGLPLSPRHSDEKCGVLSAQLRVAPNPFGVLAGLKK